MPSLKPTIDKLEMFIFWSRWLQAPLYLGLIIAQMAYVYLFKDNDRDRSEVRRLIDAQKQAIERKVALFGLTYEREEYYIANQSSFRLHRPGCESVADIKPKNSRRFATREEGIAEGLSPCRNCKP